MMDMKKAFLALAVLSTLGVTVAQAAPTAGPKPKLSIAQARAIALKKAPGKVTKAEYEKEGGAWRYSFDIRQDNKNHEIGVNPNTGAIVENSVEPFGKAD
jgi:uncharacterized membrane protein YkoI